MQRKFKLSNSPVDVAILNKLIINYPNQEVKNKLLKGFQFGFSLEYDGDRKCYTCNNLKSALENKPQVQEIIDKEIQEGRVDGPFNSPPMDDLRISPLGLVPKKEPGKFRLIHHLSYPAGDSVNDHIDPELCSVHYTRFDTAVQMVQRLGKGALLEKADIKSAFRLMPVSPKDFCLLGFKFEGKYYFDKALPFGCSISCALFETFSSILEWIIKQKCNQAELEHYLDDFIFGGRVGTDHCLQTMNTFFDMCNCLGVPIANDKTVWPTTVLVFLGLELDSMLLQVRIPTDKIKQIVTLIEEILNKKSITLKTMQSIIGLLNFMCRAIVPGRPFCRRLINSTRGITKPYHHIRISKGLQQDLKTWLTFFKKFNGISMFHDKYWSSNGDVCLFTDSSAAIGNGFGAYFKGKWTCGKWPVAWHLQGLTADITLLEYFPILVAIYIWGDQLRNKKVNLRCDNASVVSIINTQTSKSQKIMVLVRALTLKCLEFNLVLKAEHIAGVKNDIADSLSRFQLERFRKLAPTAEEHPVTVPKHLWNIFNLSPDSY